MRERRQQKRKGTRHECKQKTQQGAKKCMQVKSMNNYIVARNFTYNYARKQQTRQISIGKCGTSNESILQVNKV